MTVVWIIILAFVVISAVTTAWGAWRAAPYVPTRQRDVERMLDLAELRDGETLYDLGAGDGRLMLQAMQRGPSIKTVGYEISLPVWLIAWLRIVFGGFRQRAAIHFQDFFHHDLSQANVVVCFLTPEAMKKLGPKLKAELKPGSRVVSSVFPIKEWTEVTRSKPTPNVVSVYLYRI